MPPEISRDAKSNAKTTITEQLYTPLVNTFKIITGARKDSVHCLGGRNKKLAINFLADIQCFQCSHEYRNAVKEEGRNCTSSVMKT